jgi:hypothetical protein
MISMRKSDAQLRRRRMRDDQGENGRVETSIEEAAAELASASKDAMSAPDGFAQSTAAAPPRFIRPNFDRMPPELKTLKNWVLWAPVWSGTKWTKRPTQISGYGASTTNPKHWSCFDEVKSLLSSAVTWSYAKRESLYNSFMSAASDSSSMASQTRMGLFSPA